MGSKSSPDASFNPGKEVPVTPAVEQSDRPTTSYFSPKFNTPFSDKHEIVQSPSPTAATAVDAKSPTAAAAGDAKSPKELLRRMSIVRTHDPRSDYPALDLTGHVISATFAIPYAVTFGSSEWTLSPRRGTSALFDSFTHLSSPQSHWKHTLVGWTGEVKSPSYATPPATPPGGIKASAPIPVNGDKPPTTEGNGIWLTKADRESLERQLAHEKEGRVVPVWMFDEADDSKGDVRLKDQGRWRRYAEHELYTLFHYKQHEPTDGRAERKWWADYHRLNQRFADRILEIYKPGDIVWIHDYHLLLLPNLLRQRIPRIYIGFFLHIPFPSSEFLRCLSKRKELLEGILGANMIGFQSYGYSRHFSSCCTRILGFQSSSAGVDAYGAHVAVDVFPIGIDAAAAEKAAFGANTIEEKMAGIRELYAGKKIIVGRDRLDSVRGVAQKLMAFEMFLERYPEWRDRVLLIQVTSPTSIEEEKEDGKNKISNKVSELVSRINGLYGSLSFSPVQHYPQYLSQDEYFALLRVADVGLITSVRDGMNTTSLEYIICQKENHGPLILSEFSGTAGTLRHAMHINPWDLGGVADSINEALTMSSDLKRVQHQSLYRHVTKHTVQAWSANYLHRLLTNLSSFDQSNATPALDREALLAQYRKAKKRLFMFDYDGTLTPIVKDPSAAIPTDRVIRTLKTLASDPRNNVWIISGRDQNFLNQWMGDISELGLSAEHGSFIREPRQDEWENLTEKIDMSWQKDVMEVFQHYTERTQGSFIERKKIALTWHYRRADPEYGAYQSRECQRDLERGVATKWDVEVMVGKANVEVRPQFVNKGAIARRLVEAYGPDFVLCMGDDNTDEEMFRVLERRESFFSVSVGASTKGTLGGYYLLEPSDVVETIATLH